LKPYHLGYIFSQLAAQLKKYLIVNPPDLFGRDYILRSQSQLFDIAIYQRLSLFFVEDSQKSFFETNGKTVPLAVSDSLHR
jgi:hypothetical protein